eukprot:4377803-Amphidinium_carterae.1
MLGLLHVLLHQQARHSYTKEELHFGMTFAPCPCLVFVHLSLRNLPTLDAEPRAKYWRDASDYSL